MNNKEFQNQWETIPPITLEPPVVESFSDPARAAQAWPEKIANNAVFLEQIASRKELNERLNETLSSLPRPDTSLEDAIEQGCLTEERVAVLYDSLSDLLLNNPDYKRLILYLPFEFLPDKSWQPADERLRNATDKFKKAYLESWKSLLAIYDVRANFVDGDVLEDDQRAGDFPRVVKAAHLVPRLVGKGLMELSEIITLMETSNDQLLKDSLADALPVLADMGFIAEKELQAMTASPDRLVSNMARLIAADVKTATPSPDLLPITPTLAEIQEKINAEFSSIDAKDYGDITARRKAWLTQKKKQEAINALAKNISAAIVNDDFSDENAANFLGTEAEATSQQTLIEGIRQAIESAGATDPAKAALLYSRFQKILSTLHDNKQPGTEEALAKTFRRLRQLDIIDDAQLEKLDVAMPKLAGPFSENLKLMTKETDAVKDAIMAIEANPELSQLIYPVVLLQGSRLKGYGEPNSDTDLSVFVKPGTPFDDQAKLRELLKQVFPPGKFQGEAVEFWLQEKDGMLKIRDFDNWNETLGESPWTHVLFGAAWEGDKDSIRQLREKLLTPYLYETDKMIRGRDARSMYLEELERDTLQYRLMHKGYERFFPAYGGVRTPHADEIDGESAFWDSGFRQLATRLFASRVFLPKLPSPEK